MTIKEFFKIVPARQFFPRYAAKVKRYYHKNSGIDGNGKPITFSAADKQVIKDGIKQFREDLKNVKF